MARNENDETAALVQTGCFPQTPFFLLSLNLSSFSAQLQNVPKHTVRGS